MGKDYSEATYNAYMKIAQKRIEEYDALHKSIHKHRWVTRLTFEQWVDYQNGKLQMYDPLNGSEVIGNRMFNYYFDTGDIVVFDKLNMEEAEIKRYKNFIDKEGVVTRCWSDFHAFAQGSAYSVEVSFDGKPFNTDFDPETFLPTNFLPIGYLIKKI